MESAARRRRHSSGYWPCTAGDRHSAAWRVSAAGTGHGAELTPPAEVTLLAAVQLTRFTGHTSHPKTAVQDTGHVQRAHLRSRDGQDVRRARVPAAPTLQRSGDPWRSNAGYWLARLYIASGIDLPPLKDLADGRRCRAAPAQHVATMPAHH